MKKIISFLATAALIASLIIVPLGASAEAADNLLLGIVPTASTTDSWLLSNRPLSNITDGSGTTLTNDNNAYASPCTLSNVKGKAYSWCRFDFKAETRLNKVIIQEKAEMDQSRDIAIDVLLASGGWKRAALKYNISDTFHAIVFTFSPVNVISMRITFGSARTGNGGTDIAEIEGYYDESLTAFDSLQKPDNDLYEIEDTFAEMNLLRGIKATSSNTNSWFATDRPVSLLTDGTGTSYSIDWEAEYKNPASITAETNTQFAWVQLELPQAMNINKIIIQQHKENTDFPLTKDFTVDILLEGGGWKRVASSYDTGFKCSGFYMTFEAVRGKAIRVTGRNGSIHISEIEAYYDSSISEYTGIGTPADSTHEIPELLSKMNAFRLIPAKTSNTNGDMLAGWKRNDFEALFPTSNLSDGSGTSYWNGDYAPYGSYTKLLNQSGTKYAWAEFKLPEPKTINTVDIQYRELDVKAHATDYAVDVKLGNGVWKRVASEYGVSAGWPYTVRITFEPEKADKVRITFNNARNNADHIDIAEIECNYNSGVTEYTGIGYNVNYEIPEITAGDINADYSLDSADLVILRKMLLGIDTEYEFTDQNNDGVCDIRDLVAMKKSIYVTA